MPAGGAPRFERALRREREKIQVIQVKLSDPTPSAGGFSVYDGPVQEVCDR